MRRLSKGQKKRCKKRLFNRIANGMENELLRGTRFDPVLGTMLGRAIRDLLNEPSKSRQYFVVEKLDEIPKQRTK